MSITVGGRPIIPELERGTLAKAILHLDMCSVAATTREEAEYILQRAKELNIDAKLIEFGDGDYLLIWGGHGDTALGHIVLRHGIEYPDGALGCLWRVAGALLSPELYPLHPRLHMILDIDGEDGERKRFSKSVEFVKPFDGPPTEDDIRAAAFTFERFLDVLYHTVVPWVGAAFRKKHYLEQKKGGAA